jgi:caffeoyl-CoA O-methyltransferase
MTESKDELFETVDRYIDDLFIGDDVALEAVDESLVAADMPQISVSPSQGKLLYILARAIGAQRILELGTLAGYSTIWMARALPADGKLVTVEVDAKHADVAKKNIARAGLADRVDVRVSAALDVLQELIAAGGPKFDFVFIDADKQPYKEYFEASQKLTRSGGLIIADNVVREGGVIDEQSDDAMVQGVRRFNAALARNSAVSATILQTVGVKGHDGFAIAIVN